MAADVTPQWYTDTWSWNVSYSQLEIYEIFMEVQSRWSADAVLIQQDESADDKQHLRTDDHTMEPTRWRGAVLYYMSISNSGSSLWPAADTTDKN